MNEFEARIVADLQAFSGELLQAGTAPARRMDKNGKVAGATGALVRAAERIIAQLPQLIATVDAEETFSVGLLHAARTPLHATVSRRAADYACIDGRWMPTGWLREAHSEQPALQPLRWLAWLMARLGELLEQARGRLQKQVDDAAMTRDGHSSYAKNDLAALHGVLDPVEQAIDGLRRARATLAYRAGRPVAPSSRLPNPFPRAQAWRSLRTDTQALLNPEAGLPGLIQRLCSEPVMTADIPYLYQRWCGLKLLQAFERLGWSALNDPVGPLFLGGRIGLRRGQVHMTMWVEPRIGPKTEGLLGFRTRSGDEVTPDYMVVTPGHHGEDAFILDATKTGDEGVLRGKDKYLRAVVASDARMVAGVPVERAPLRAWAAAPIRTPLCRLFDDDGRSGAVPMHPADWDHVPLMEWAGDIADHALAWG